MKRSIVGRILLVILVFSGCGTNGLRGERLPVSGTVTLDGKPLPYGLVEFSQAAERGELQTAVVRDGRFSLATPQGLPEGRYGVCLLPYVPEAEELDRLPPEERKAVAAASDRIPPPYRRRGVFKAEITGPDPAPLTFEMTTKP